MALNVAPREKKQKDLPLHERRFVWSYSKLKNFESCPRRHYEIDILKKWPESTEALDEGNAVHDALSKAVGDVNGKDPEGKVLKPLPPKYVSLQPYVDDLVKLRSPGTKVITELRLAIRQDFSLASDYFGPDVWFRANVDVSILRPPALIIKDWKTGKRKDDSVQLQLSGICALARFPNVERIRTEFIWLAEDDKSVETFDRKDVPGIWNEIAPRVAELEAAYKNPDVQEAFPPNPGFLCRKWCAVKSCPYNGT